MSEKLWTLTAHEMVKRVKSRELSRVDLVQAHLERIEATNPQVNALVELRADEALEEARAADAQHGSRDGLALDGIPFSIKDHFDVKGMKHTEGLPSMADVRSPADEVVIQRLRAAGAIIVGKANQPDLQIRWNTVSHLYGTTLNPRDLTKTAGGSSGGDAAAVAAGMAPIGLGLDYGGSIRVPAAFCGIYGLRPSAGRVPAVPTVPPFDSQPTVDLMASIGPLARCVEDLWLAYETIAGHDARDPATLPIAVKRPEVNGVRPRVARMVDQTGAKVSPEMIQRLDETARILTDAGYEVVDMAIPNAHRAPEVWAHIIGTELMQVGMPEFGAQLGESNRQHIEEFFGVYQLGNDVADYVNAMIERRMIVREIAHWMEDYPLVLSPIAGMVTPPIEFDHMLNRADTLHLFDQMRNIPWVNLCGIPGVALPNGIQIVARRFQEAQALQAAAEVEKIIGAAPLADL